jgi:hypothetical protein
MAGRLAQKAYGAFRLLEDTAFKQRAKSLESIEEFSYALILYWNQIEAALKLMRYGYCIQYGWPDKLDFIRATWVPLKRLKISQCDHYEIILGVANSSLRNKRNEIAHEGCNTTEVDYGKYVESARIIIGNLHNEVPKLEKLREGKRRYEIQSAN